MRWLALIVVAVLIGFAVTTYTDSDLKRLDGIATWSPDSRSGSATVYAEIAASTDCGWLQASFDRAAVNNDSAAWGSDEAKWTADYMSAANDRMQALGCYG